MTTLFPQTIALVRHGETDWNLANRIQGRTDIHLNDTGRAQAAATAALLPAAGSWQRLVASPLTRAVQTAEILAAGLGLGSPATDEELWERDFGPAEGWDIDEAKAKWPGLEMPGAESGAALAERAARAMSRILTNAPGSVVVAHGALIRSGLELITDVKLPRIVNGEVWLLTRETASVTPRTYRFEAAELSA